MNYFKLTSRTVHFLILLISPSAFAAPVVVQNSQCVATTARLAHESITNYDGYTRLQGARLQMDIGGIATIPLLTMIKAQSRVQRADLGTDAMVWFVLQPTNLTEAQYYPRFLLQCTSRWVNSGQFVHRCAIVGDKPKYGVESFQSVLEGTENSPVCREGQTLVTYQLTLSGNSDHVQAIKREVLRPAGVLKEVIGSLFQEEKFYRQYYENFYNGWIRSLR